VYVHTSFDGFSWVLAQKLMNVPGQTAGSVYGTAVAVSYNGSVIAAASTADSTLGCIAMYTLNALTWVFEQRICPSDASDTLIQFGYAVSLDKLGMRLAVGAPSGTSRSASSRAPRAPADGHPACLGEASWVNTHMGRSRCVG